MNWHMIIGSFVYLAIGFAADKVVTAYLNELFDKAAKVDCRYLKKMQLTIYTKSETEKRVLSVLLFTVWPIVAIIAILKAENGFSFVKNDWRYRTR